MEQVNILKTKETVEFMGNYSAYDLKKYNSISCEINTFLKKYGTVDIESKENP